MILLRRLLGASIYGLCRVYPPHENGHFKLHKSPNSMLACTRTGSVTLAMSIGFSFADKSACVSCRISVLFSQAVIQA